MCVFAKAVLLHAAADDHDDSVVEFDRSNGAVWCMTIGCRKNFY
jgi:hypothetical protein